LRELVAKQELAPRGAVPPNAIAITRLLRTSVTCLRANRPY